MPTPAGEYIGDEVREARLKYDLTQEEVCAAWGRPQSNLSEIEHNRRRVSRKRRAELMAVIRYLGEEWERVEEEVVQ